MGIVFAGVIAAIVLSYRALMHILTDTNKTLLHKVEMFTLASLSFMGSQESEHPMVGPATLQQLVKMKEDRDKPEYNEGEQVKKAQQPRPGVTIRSTSGV
jgi:hypothetical protein